MDIAGSAQVLDGDTLKIDGTTYRLWGIDAPELHEPLGKYAKHRLTEMTHNRTVKCTDKGSRSHGRVIAVCYVQLVELNRWMVQEGYALDCAAYSGGKYRMYERESARAQLINKPYCRREQ
jgi:micrococcal nuclease